MISKNKHHCLLTTTENYDGPCLNGWGSKNNTKFSMLYLMLSVPLVRVASFSSNDSLGSSHGTIKPLYSLAFEVVDATLDVSPTVFIKYLNLYYNFIHKK